MAAEYKEAAPGPAVRDGELGCTVRLLNTTFVNASTLTHALFSTLQLHGLRLATCHVRRGAPDVQDPAWNSHSKLNCIAACVQANAVGADESLLLDPHGFVATCNSTNFFVVVAGADGVERVWAPTDKYQMPGITRAHVLRLCAALGVPCEERDFSLTTVRARGKKERWGMNLRG